MILQFLWIYQISKSKYSEQIIASKSGYLGAVDNYEIGMSALQLGAGRLTKDDIIEPKAGIIFKS